MISNKYGRPPKAGDIEDEGDQHAFYLAPLPLPTGTNPFSSRNSQQQTNDIYMDFALRGVPFEFAIRMIATIISGITLLLFLIELLLAAYSNLNFGRLILEESYISFLSHWLIPSFLLSASMLYVAPLAWQIFLTTRTPPIRFNRQRREVAYVAKRGQPPHIVPWESVVACVSTRTIITEYGSQQYHALMICLCDSKEDPIVSLTIASYTAADALREWEAIRLYMEEGPYTTTTHYGLSELEFQEGTVEHFQLCRRGYRRDNGYLMYLFGFVLLQCLGGWTLPCHITAWIQRLPRTSFPKSIREWSKPLPEDQWQQPSAELVEQSKEVRKALRYGRTLIDYCKNPPNPNTGPKPGSITARRKQRKQARLKLHE